MLNAAFKDQGLLVESKIQQIDGSRKKETFLGIVSGFGTGVHFLVALDHGCPCHHTVFLLHPQSF